MQIKQKISLNWKSGLTVALVSIPLSVSLAVASESTPVIGIVTAIWAGLIASLFGGSNYNIIGPTGALSGILATYAISHGTTSLSMLALTAGVFILIAYFFTLEKYLIFVPASTIHGFTLGVAFIIGLNQLNFALGLNGPAKHEKFILNVLESFKHLNQTSLATFFIFLLFLAGLFIFARLTPKLPGAIILAPLGILLGFASIQRIIPVSLLTLGTKYTDIAPALFVPSPLRFDPSLLVAGLTVALIAILETMISAKIADGMTRTKHNKRKEMLGLGLSNIASGLAGGIPATAALARTSLNVKTKATDKMSATLSSIFIATISLFFLGTFQYIPLAVIASILVFVAIRMVEREHFIRMFQRDKKSFVIALIVAGITVIFDPIDGILVGTAIALLLFMENLSKGQFELIISDQNKKIVQRVIGHTLKTLNQDPHTLVYSIKGQLAYINAQAHLARFENSLNGYENIILRLRELYFIDLDGVDAFEEIISHIRHQEKKVIVTGVNPLIRKMLEQSKVFRELEESGVVFDRTSHALKYLGYSVSSDFHYQELPEKNNLDIRNQLR